MCSMNFLAKFFQEIVENNEEVAQEKNQPDFNKKLLFITGRAGTGKSTLLRKLCADSGKNFVVLAPTGIAAVNVLGETIHSFFRFKPGITYEEAESYGMHNQQEIYERLEVLIIDEISMVRADLLDSVDIFLRRARKNDEPFGGVQVVLFGDLYQLEPIVTSEERDIIYSRYKSPYFFSSHVFKQLLSAQDQSIEFIELTKVYRQKDKEFIHLLDKIRKKKITDEELNVINGQYEEFLSDTKEGFIYLTTTNAGAERINLKNLSLLPTKEYHLIGEVEGNFPDKNLPTAFDLVLKVGARIILLTNDQDKQWYNGTLATVTGVFEDRIMIRLDDGKQHMLTPFTWSYYKYTYDKKKKKIIKQVVGTYTQFPLKLAWAITIHKSQGQTFDTVVIWLEGRAFSKGQVYVALSRCKTLDGIALNRPIQHFDILVDDVVRKFLIAIRKYISNYKLPHEDKLKLLADSIKKGSSLIIHYLDIDEDLLEHHVLPRSVQIVSEKEYVVCTDVFGKKEMILLVENIMLIKSKKQISSLS